VKDAPRGQACALGDDRARAHLVGTAVSLDGFADGPRQ
jgi:hypothetical protein